jgi:hypothetical protein
MANERGDKLGTVHCLFNFRRLGLLVGVENVVPFIGKPRQDLPKSRFGGTMPENQNTTWFNTRMRQ